MSVFTAAEIASLQGQPLGRLATVGVGKQPHVVPVTFRYNLDLDVDAIDIGGHDFARRKKFRDVRRNPRVAFVVDDVPSVKPWVARGIEIRGVAEALETGGEQILRGFARQVFRIRPRRIVSWGIAGAAFSWNARSVG